jgi:hypothetical protein
MIQSYDVRHVAEPTFLSVPIGQPRIVEHDSRDPVGLQSESLEKPLAHHHSALRVACSQEARCLGFGVRCNPGR